MKSEMKLSSRMQLLVGAALVLLIVVARVLPHLANFAPVVAVGLLGGFAFSSRLQAISVVLIGMLLSDVLIGFESLGMRLVVYLAFVLPVFLGHGLRSMNGSDSRLKFGGALFGSTLLSSIAFFLTTNFAVWLEGTLYTHTWAGFISCYVNAIPFFRTAIAGDLVYTAALFGAWALVQHWAARSETETEVAADRAV